MGNSFQALVDGGDLDTLVGAAVEHLEQMGYRKNSVRHYRQTWQALIRFAEESGRPGIDQDLVESFLVARGVPAIEDGAEATPYQRHLRASARVLLEFQMHGCFQRRRLSAEKVPLPAWAQTFLSEFERFCIEHLGTSFRTMRTRIRDISRFLYFIHSHGLSGAGEITAEHLGDFMTSRAYLRPKTLSVTASHLRCFLNYLSTEGVVEASLVERVPKVHVRRDERIPDVWSREEVEALLAAVDRTSPMGKRDFAILLLAARLGMRVGDIRELRLKELRWDEARIERCQSKTGMPLILPLTREVGEAIIDYLRNGRPESPHREVFLRIHAPFAPLGRNNNLHSIITTYRRRAGIPLRGRSRKGMHSLRHTVATRLLEAETPLPVISAVMGHLSSDSTRIYAKVDIATLRQVALEPWETPHE